MRHTESMRELSSLLSRIEDVDREITIFLCLCGYGKFADIVDPGEIPIQMDVSVEFNATVAKDVLRMVCEEQKANDHPETAVKAMELCLRLSDLEKEVMDRK